MRFFKTDTDIVLLLEQQLGEYLLMTNGEQYHTTEVVEISITYAIWHLILDAKQAGLDLIYKGKSIVDLVVTFDSKSDQLHIGKLKAVTVTEDTVNLFSVNKSLVEECCYA